MKISRRTLIKSGLVAWGTLPLFGCEKINSDAAKFLGQGVPEHVNKLAAHPAPCLDDDFHLLSRATYGLWPGDLDRLKALGRHAWLDEQLHPQKINDQICELRAQRFETIDLDPGTCFEFKKDFLRDELVRHTLLRAIYSRRQLFEVMVGFWSDHLNIDVGKGDAIYAKGTDDRLVIRANALGNFQNLIAASATSAAMLIYLDGKENRRPSSNSIPNENYARELLELHTLGVNGGYTQKDVYEVARCLTGWRIHSPWQRGIVYFDQSLHDNGTKEVLGQHIAAGGGDKDLLKVITIVCQHPATSTHIATKLIRHFVSEDPPESLVQKVASTFTDTTGDIKEVLKSLFQSEEFFASRGEKIKRPFHFTVSALRAVAADTYAHKELTEYLNRMGQSPFQYPTPDGYPDGNSHWVNNLLWRWNLALALGSNAVPAVTTDTEALVKSLALSDKQATHPDTERLFAYFCGRQASRGELKTLETYTNELPAKKRTQQLIALIMASPAFQRC